MERREESLRDKIRKNKLPIPCELYSAHSDKEFHAIVNVGGQVFATSVFEDFIDKIPDSIQNDDDLKEVDGVLWVNAIEQKGRYRLLAPEDFAPGNPLVDENMIKRAREIKAVFYPPKEEK